MNSAVHCSIRRLATLLLTAIASVFTACSSQIVGVPPSLDKPVVSHPGDTRAYYQDDESSHTITLMAGGTYIFESSDMYGGEVASREGTWRWSQKGTHNAELTLDNDVWTLSFISHDNAIAVNTAASGRTFAFQFERF